jgi:ABC-type dipeptide/oligopeptide/nickel transport system permease component
VGLLAGTVVIEVIFAWPGIGKLMVDAIRLRDYQVTQAVVIFVAAMVIIVNLGIDIIYALLDPRIRYT